MFFQFNLIVLVSSVVLSHGQIERGEHDWKILKREFLDGEMEAVPVGKRWRDDAIARDPSAFIQAHPMKCAAARRFHPANAAPARTEEVADAAFCNTATACSMMRTDCFASANKIRNRAYPSPSCSLGTSNSIFRNPIGCAFRKSRTSPDARAIVKQAIGHAF